MLQPMDYELRLGRIAEWLAPAVEVAYVALAVVVWLVMGWGDDVHVMDYSIRFLQCLLLV
jgi:hypothetical protein